MFKISKISPAKPNDPSRHNRSSISPSMQRALISTKEKREISPIHFDEPSNTLHQLLRGGRWVQILKVNETYDCNGIPANTLKYSWGEPGEMSRYLTFGPKDHSYSSQTIWPDDKEALICSGTYGIISKKLYIHTDPSTRFFPYGPGAAGYYEILEPTHHSGSLRIREFICQFDPVYGFKKILMRSTHLFIRDYKSNNKT